ncbi:hypothetical protein [Fodinicola feengrottensis]|uniref:hypothetical protein n=1 Tax=Fodinicola feengrottensis TaxID=435914 RepID=UPI0031DDB9C9
MRTSVQAVLTAVAVSVALGVPAVVSTGAAAAPVPSAGQQAMGNPHPSNLKPTGIRPLADGNFHAYRESNYVNGCYWSGDSANWVFSGGCGNFNDTASSVWNNGYAANLDGVLMFKDINYGGPFMCLSRGDSWGDLNLGIERFSDGSFANDQISSHRWSDFC